MKLTEKIESTRLRPRIKLLGRKARSDPAISIMFLRAITHSMRASWKRSTMSASVVRSAWRAEGIDQLTGTHDLEQVLLFKFLEDGFGNV
jgi:hypothetical protein